jgi:hypothetical protein
MPHPAVRDPVTAGASRWRAGEADVGDRAEEYVMDIKEINRKVVEQFRAGGPVEGMHRDRLFL